MNQAQTDSLLRSFARTIERSWLSSVRLADSDVALARKAAERFADKVIELAIRAGYKEAQHLSGLFDPTLAADRFRVERSLLVSRFMSDVERALGGSSVGLSVRQRRDLRAFAATLERASLDSIDFAEPPVFTRRESSRQVKRLERAMLAERGRLIGRTESTAAASLGVDIAVEQTESLTGERVERKWLTAADEKVRSSHAVMSGQIKPIGEPFISGNGIPLMRPGDPSAPISERANCRCMLITGG